MADPHVPQGLSDREAWCGDERTDGGRGTSQTSFSLEDEPGNGSPRRRFDRVCEFGGGG